MQLVLVVICLIFFVVGCVAGKKNAENKFLLVSKKEGVSSQGDNILCSILHFGKKIYKKDELFAENDCLEEGEIRFFVPLVGNSLYVNRTVTRKVYPNGFVEYGDNGYDMPLKDNEIKKAFNNVENYYHTHCVKS